MQIIIGRADRVVGPVGIDEQWVRGVIGHPAEAVATRVLRLLDDVVPRLALGLDHQRNPRGVMGKLALDLANLREVFVERSVGDQFDVVRPHDLSTVVVHGPVAAGDVDDRLVVDRLSDRPAPARVPGSSAPADDKNNGSAIRACPPLPRAPMESACPATITFSRDPQGSASMVGARL